MARRFPALELVGVEFEADSVARARAKVEAAGLTDRITIRQGECHRARAQAGEYDLAYFQYALHQLTDAPAVAARRPGRRSIPAAACSSSTGRCRPSGTSSGRATAS